MEIERRGPGARECGPHRRKPSENAKIAGRPTPDACHARHGGLGVLHALPPMDVLCRVYSAVAYAYKPYEQSSPRLYE